MSSATIIMGSGTSKTISVGGDALSSILAYKDDFDIMYLFDRNYATITNDFLMALTDVNGNNALTPNGVSYPSYNGYNFGSINEDQGLSVGAGDQANFNIGINDFYVLMYVRLNKFIPEKTKSYILNAGANIVTTSGFSFHVTDVQTPTPIFWFAMSDGTLWKQVYGTLNQDLFDNEFHAIEILIDRDVGGQIWIDGVLQPEDGDVIIDLNGNNIVCNKEFTINSLDFATTTPTSQLIKVVALKKSLPTTSERTSYRNTLRAIISGWSLNPHFSLPIKDDGDVLPMIVGETLTIYGDTLCNVPISNNLSVEYSCDIGSASGNNYTITPIVGDTGNHDFDVIIKNGNIIIEKLQSQINVAAKTNTGNKSITLLGDSLVLAGGDDEYGILESVFDGITWTSIGTVTVGSVNHEGHSGKTYEWFATHADSPLTKAGVIDIPAYYTDNGLSVPVFLYMRCGVNTAFDESSSEMTRAEMLTWIGHLEDLIDAFLAHDANIEIIIGLPTISENTGDGWEANYPGNTNQDKYIEIIHYMWQELIFRYENGNYNARVYVCYAPLYLNRDTGYPKTDGVHTNGVHPNADGYDMLGAGLAATINKIL